MKQIDLKVINSNASCCETGQGKPAAYERRDTVPPSWITGLQESNIGPVPRISTKLTFEDRWGAFRCRISGLRNRYTVQPGLYAVGSPGPQSEVFASANYKLSFDALRAALHGQDAWVLVLDTKGINVWCAAGKGTFGTAELIARIRAEDLTQIVAHRRIIVPQLAAPGVAAPRVKEESGFTVRFGPVLARDIPAYLQRNRSATPGMRTVRFPLRDRLVLTPMELIPAMRFFPWFALGVLVFFGLRPDGIIFADAWRGGAPFLALGLGAVFAGAFATPVLLPFLPFRSFALKGLVAGLVVQGIGAYGLRLITTDSLPLIAGANLFFPLAASYIALQFTGSTTFTGPTGVEKELRAGIPFYLGGSAVTLVVMVVHKMLEWSWI